MKGSNSVCKGAFLCEVCGKLFNSKSNLNEHRIIHVEGTRYKCRDCHKSFLDHEDLLSHCKRVHVPEKPYSCETCGKGFTKISSLKVHSITHQNFKPHKCKICEETFRLKRHLDIHVGTHLEEERPHHCSNCPKKFVRATALRRHMRIHTNEKPYRCTQCDKTFSECGSLKRHYRVHNKEKPYQCQICGKTFSQTNNLKSHENMHGNTKPYQCSKCGKSFNQKSNLNTHTKISCGKVKSKIQRSDPLTENTYGRANLSEDKPLNDTTSQTVTTPEIYGSNKPSFMLEYASGSEDIRNTCNIIEQAMSAIVERRNFYDIY